MSKACALNQRPFGLQQGLFMSNYLLVSYVFYADFDVDMNCYSEWNKEINRGIKGCAHIIIKCESRGVDSGVRLSWNRFWFEKLECCT